MTVCTGGSKLSFCTLMQLQPVTITIMQLHCACLGKSKQHLHSLRKQADTHGAAGHMPQITCISAVPSPGLQTACSHRPNNKHVFTPLLM